MPFPSQVYVRANSKAALNRDLEAGVSFEALYYGFRHNDVFDLETLPDGCVVKVFDKYVDGTPYAKAYGTIKRKPDGTVRVA